MQVKKKPKKTAKAVPEKSRKKKQPSEDQIKKQPFLKRMLFGEEKPDLSELEAGSTTILDILSPTTVDTKSRDYIIVDDVYHAYLYNRAQASRRQASRSQRRFFAAREDLHAVGSRITCRMLAVGPRRCLVDCYGYDLDMTQREIRYAAIPDLRTEFHPGSEIDCIVKEYHPRTGELIVSAKETEVNPFFGAEERHPVGSRRFAMISGKYGGGVFCNLPDGVTCMCNYSYQHEDADFMVGEHVMLMVQRYDQEKLQMYGKIMSKW